MTATYSRAYGKGYTAGSNRRWPEHKPPYPPQAEVRALMEAVHKLRDCADHLCATIDPEDDWYKELSPGIDEVDAALVKISEWLKRATDS